MKKVINTKAHKIQAGVYHHTHSSAVAGSEGRYATTDDLTAYAPKSELNPLKTKLDGIEAGANKTVTDDFFSATSENPVQNKVIKNAMGTANGIATLDANGKLLTSQLPTSTRQIVGEFDAENNHTLPDITDYGPGNELLVISAGYYIQSTAFTLKAGNTLTELEIAQAEKLIQNGYVFTLKEGDTELGTVKSFESSGVILEDDTVISLPHSKDLSAVSTPDSVQITVKIGDEIVSIDNHWICLSNTSTVDSVNGKGGAVVLDADDVGAISNDNLVTSFGANPSDLKVPSEKLVKESLNNKLDADDYDPSEVIETEDNSSALSDDDLVPMRQSGTVKTSKLSKLKTWIAAKISEVDSSIWTAIKTKIDSITDNTVTTSSTNLITSSAVKAALDGRVVTCTQSEYDALTSEQKAGKLFVVSDSESSEYAKLLNDLVTASDTTWSSSKISTELNTVSSNATSELNSSLANYIGKGQSVYPQDYCSDVNDATTLFNTIKKISASTQNMPSSITGTTVIGYVNTIPLLDNGTRARQELYAEVYNNNSWTQYHYIRFRVDGTWLSWTKLTTETELNSALVNYTPIKTLEVSDTTVDALKTLLLDSIGDLSNGDVVKIIRSSQNRAILMVNKQSSIYFDIKIISYYYTVDELKYNNGTWEENTVLSNYVSKFMAETDITISSTYGLTLTDTSCKKIKLLDKAIYFGSFTLPENTETSKFYFTISGISSLGTAKVIGFYSTSATYQGFISKGATSSLWLTNNDTTQETGELLSGMTVNFILIEV